MAEFRCNWIVSCSKNISDVVSYRSEEQETGTCTDPDGITLRPPNDVDSCVLTINCKFPPTFGISAIDILANVRHLELSSSSGEYLTTLQGFRVDQELGCSNRLYALQHTFECSMSKLSVKFVSLERTEEIWLHSIHITTCPAASLPLDMSSMFKQYSNLGLPRVDMVKVTSILAEMGSSLNPQAEELMASISSKQKEKMCVDGNTPLMLMSMLNQMNVLPQHDENSSKIQPVPTLQNMSVMDGLCRLISSSADFNSPALEDSAKSDSSNNFMPKEKPNPSNTNENEIRNCHESPSKDSMILQRCSHCNSMVQIKDLEQRLMSEFAEIEKRLEKNFSDRLSITEKRLTEKLDNLLLFLQKEPILK